LHDAGGVDLRSFEGELSGELQSVHHDAGIPVVDASFAEGITDLGDGDLDAFAISDGREVEVLMGVPGAIQGFVKLLVVVAVGHSAERGAVAVTSSGHDVATSFDFEHGNLPGGYPLPPTFLG
jgi:hypothetical protein